MPCTNVVIGHPHCAEAQIMTDLTSCVATAGNGTRVLYPSAMSYIMVLGDLEVRFRPCSGPLEQDEA